MKEGAYHAVSQEDRAPVQLLRQRRDHEVICAKKGIVPAESHCGAFRYDPLKRVPPRPAKLETEELRQEDFQL